MNFIKLFFPTILFCFCLDMLWLGVVAKSTYHESLGHLMKKSNDAFAPNWQAALLVYIAIAIGIICFSLPKADGNYAAGICGEQFWVQ